MSVVPEGDDPPEPAEEVTVASFGNETASRDAVGEEASPVTGDAPRPRVYDAQEEGGELADDRLPPPERADEAPFELLEGAYLEARDRFEEVLEVAHRQAQRLVGNARENATAIERDAEIAGAAKAKAIVDDAERVRREADEYARDIRLSVDAYAAQHSREAEEDARTVVAKAETRAAEIHQTAERQDREAEERAREEAGTAGRRLAALEADRVRAVNELRAMARRVDEIVALTQGRAERRGDGRAPIGPEGPTAPRGRGEVRFDRPEWTEPAGGDDPAAASEGIQAASGSVEPGEGEGTEPVTTAGEAAERPDGASAEMRSDEPSGDATGGRVADPADLGARGD